jgi:hypothetical protein
MSIRGKIVLAGLLAFVVGGLLLISGHKKIKIAPAEYGRSKPAKYSAMIRISSSKGICTATVFAANYALTAGHCVAGQIGDKYDIGAVNDDGYKSKATSAIAVRVTMYGGLDVGLLAGDFSEFVFAPLENGELKYGPVFVSCGHAGGSPTAICRPLLQVQPYGFIAVGLGNLIPGMSGGPVIDPFSGKVVGVNSAQDGNTAFFTPTTKVLSFFGLDYADDER